MAVNGIGGGNDATGSTSKTKGKGMALKPEDFIKMMITQLQNQDPMEPAKNEQLLAQMSQIGQLQSSTLLNDSLKTMVLQNQIGSAGNLIGKTIQGVDDKQQAVRGVVNSVRVQGDAVHLELDNGKTIPLSAVTSIAAASASTAPTTTTTTPAAAAA